jgi:alkylhydroperoxidase family enzyme
MWQIAKWLSAVKSVRAAFAFLTLRTRMRRSLGSPSQIRVAEFWDIAAIAAFFGMSNRLANVTSMRPNDEFYAMGRSI